MVLLQKNERLTITGLPDKPLIHSFSTHPYSRNMKVIGITLIIIIGGIFSGYQLSKWTGGNTASGVPGSAGRTGEPQAKEVVGVDDAQTFRDTTEGRLETGGINGEGTHKLIRHGGESQNVYLTSSVLDLSQFEGKQVRVWGETHAAKRAGWLMDVGKVEVL